MEAHSEVMGLSYEAYREQLRFWHNGYHFSRVRLGPKDAVYNSYAISRTPANQGPAFMPTWTESGTPSVRVNDLKRNALQKRDDGNLTRVPDDLMASSSFKALSGTGIRFQCGYRTISMTPTTSRSTPLTSPSPPRPINSSKALQRNFESFSIR